MEREGGEADGPLTRVIWVWEPGLGMDLYSFLKYMHLFKCFVCACGMCVHLSERACFVHLHQFWVQCVCV